MIGRAGMGVIVTSCKAGFMTGTATLLLIQLRITLCSLVASTFRRVVPPISSTLPRISTASGYFLEIAARKLV